MSRSYKKHPWINMDKFNKYKWCKTPVRHTDEEELGDYMMYKKVPKGDWGYKFRMGRKEQEKKLHANLKEMINTGKHLCNVTHVHRENYFFFRDIDLIPFKDVEKMYRQFSLVNDRNIVALEFTNKSTWPKNSPFTNIDIPIGEYSIQDFLKKIDNGFIGYKYLYYDNRPSVWLDVTKQVYLQGHKALPIGYDSECMFNNYPVIWESKIQTDTQRHDLIWYNNKLLLDFRFTGRWKYPEFMIQLSLVTGVTVKESFEKWAVENPDEYIAQEMNHWEKWYRRK